MVIRRKSLSVAPESPPSQMTSVLAAKSAFRKDPLMQALHSLGQSLVFLGLSFVILIIIFVALTMSSVKQINSLTFAYFDFLICETAYKMKGGEGYLEPSFPLRSGAASCAELPVKNVQSRVVIQDRPSAESLVVLLSSQSAIPLFFSAFYLFIAISKRHLHSSMTTKNQLTHKAGKPSH